MPDHDPPKWVRILAVTVDRWLRDPDVRRRVVDEYERSTGLGDRVVPSAVPSKGKVVALELCECFALLAAVHDKYSEGEPLVPLSGEAVYEKTKRNIAHIAALKTLPGLLAEPDAPGELRDALRQVVAALNLPLAEYQSAAEALGLPVEDVAPTTSKVSEPTQIDLERALWDVLTENCDPAQWQLNGTEAKSAISDLCRPRWPRLLSVPETWIPRMIAERLEAHGFRVPWRQTHGPGDLGRQGGGTQLLDILRAWERDGRVETVTGADAEYADIDGRIVRGESAWRPGKRKVPPRDTPTHSPDFTSVDWFGKRYTFAKGNQAESVRELWAAWEGGGHSLSQETIGDRISSNASRFELAKVFRRRKAGGGYEPHPAWGTMIQQDSKGSYRLAPPKSA